MKPFESAARNLWHPWGRQPEHTSTDTHKSHIYVDINQRVFLWKECDILIVFGGADDGDGLW